MGVVVLGRLTWRRDEQMQKILCVSLRPDVSLTWNHMTRSKSDRSPYVSHATYFRDPGRQTANCKLRKKKKKKGKTKPNGSLLDEFCEPGR